MERGFKPHHLCLLGIGFVLLQWVISFRSPTLDIQRHDQYYVIATWQVIFTMCIPFLVFGLVYYILRSRFSQMLSNMSFLQIVFMLAAIFMIAIAGANLNALGEADSEAMAEKLNSVTLMNNSLLDVGLILSSISLVLFLITLILMISKKQK